jgi:hypothetical protein
MVVRIVPSEGEQDFSSPALPVGALGIGDSVNDAIFLGERFAVSLLLAKQPVQESAACPADWYVALPESVSATSTDALSVAVSGMKGTVDKWSGHIRRDGNDMERLRTWLNADGESAPYVFTFVGHHANGMLYYQAGAGSITHATVRRQFRNGSVAVLNACETAVPQISGATAIGSLAKSNVAVTVATTSKVSGHLAAAYITCLDKVLTKHLELPMGVAHLYTTRCLWAHENGREYFSAAALKYQLIGNPFQKICAPRTIPARETNE